MAWQGLARQGMARLGSAWQGSLKAGRGWARPGRARRGTAGQGKARRGLAGLPQGPAWQGKELIMSKKTWQRFQNSRWGHRPYAGTKPERLCPKMISCAFCQKKFSTLNAAAMHENSYHKKLLNKIREKAESDRC
jgi:hypothetical protein